MEKIVDTFVKKLCNRYSFKCIKEATSEKIMREWVLILSVDRSDRRFDFTIYSGRKLYLIETNFYGGGGSELKSTAGEYKSLYDFPVNDGHKFIWITAGLGWKVTTRPLEETFNHIDYLLNLKMLTHGLLDDIISNKL